MSHSDRVRTICMCGFIPTIYGSSCIFTILLANPTATCSCTNRQLSTNPTSPSSGTVSNLDKTKGVISCSGRGWANVSMVMWLAVLYLYIIFCLFYWKMLLWKSEKSLANTGVTHCNATIWAWTGGSFQKIKFKKYEFKEVWGRGGERWHGLLVLPTMWRYDHSS